MKICANEMEFAMFDGIIDFVKIWTADVSKKKHNAIICEKYWGVLMDSDCIVRHCKQESLHNFMLTMKCTNINY